MPVHSGELFPQRIGTGTQIAERPWKKGLPDIGSNVFNGHGQKKSLAIGLYHASSDVQGAILS